MGAGLIILTLAGAQWSVIALQLMLMPNSGEAVGEARGTIRYLAAEQKHRREANMLIMYLVIFVLLVGLLEIAARGNRPFAAPTILFAVHLTLAISCALLVWAMRVPYTGKKHPHIHRKIFPWLVFAFFGMSFTGIWLGIKLIPLLQT